METIIQILLIDKELIQNEQQEFFKDFSDFLEEKEIDSCITFHKKSVQLGYKCYLKVTEREYIHKLIKRDIKAKTKQSKRSPNFFNRSFYTKKKKSMAKIYSKLEELFPDQPKSKKLLLIYIHLRNRLSDYLELNLTDPSTEELYYVFEDIEKEKIDKILEELKEDGLINPSN